MMPDGPEANHPAECCCRRKEPQVRTSTGPSRGEATGKELGSLNLSSLTGRPAFSVEPLQVRTSKSPWIKKNVKGTAKRFPSLPFRNLYKSQSWKEPRSGRTGGERKQRACHQSPALTSWSSLAPAGSPGIEGSWEWVLVSGSRGLRWDAVTVGNCILEPGQGQGRSLGCPLRGTERPSGLRSFRECTDQSKSNSKWILEKEPSFIESNNNSPSAASQVIEASGFPRGLLHHHPLPPGSLTTQSPHQRWLQILKDMVS